MIVKEGWPHNVSNSLLSYIYRNFVGSRRLCWTRFTVQFKSKLILLASTNLAKYLHLQITKILG